MGHRGGCLGLRGICIMKSFMTSNLHQILRLSFFIDIFQNSDCIYMYIYVITVIQIKNMVDVECTVHVRDNKFIKCFYRKL
jgi:hypothetical protein